MSIVRSRCFQIQLSTWTGGTLLRCTTSFHLFGDTINGGYTIHVVFTVFGHSRDTFVVVYQYHRITNAARNLQGAVAQTELFTELWFD